MAGERRHGASRLREVLRRLEEARTRAPKGSDATWPGPVADSGSPEGQPGERAASGELLWRPFTPKALERTRPFRTAPPSRDEFESHLSQFLGARTRRTGPLFRAQGVTVRFGGVVACSEVDLELNDGEIVAVVGPNGSGKTALCDALTGFGAAGGGRDGQRPGGRDACTSVSATSRAWLPTSGPPWGWPARSSGRPSSIR